MSRNPLRPINTNTAGTGGAASTAGCAPPRVVASRTNCDPRHVRDYADDILGNLLQRETTLLRDPNYLSAQADVTERMRMILMDWLVDVADKFKVHAGTFFLAVDVVDRYLSRHPVRRNSLQLVGVTAMLLAAKVEEMYAPEIKDCIYISANTYSVDELVVMERSIAKQLDFKFTVPTAYQFLCFILDAIDADSTARNAALFFLDCSAINYSMLAYLPSQVAAAACYLGLLMIHRPTRASDPTVVRFFDAAPVAAQVVVEAADNLLAFTRSFYTDNSRYQAVTRKFSKERFSQVAQMPLPLSVTLDN